MNYLRKLIRATGAFSRGFAGKGRKEPAAADTGSSVGGFRVFLTPQVLSVREPSLISKLTGDEGGKSFSVQWPEACAVCGSRPVGFKGRLIFTDTTFGGTSRRTETTTFAVHVCETCFTKRGGMETLSDVVDIRRSDFIIFGAVDGFMYFTFEDAEFARDFYRLNKPFGAWKCTKCGHFVPEDAQNCPGCGLVQPNRSSEASVFNADAPA